APGTESVEPVEPNPVPGAEAPAEREQQPQRPPDQELEQQDQGQPQLLPQAEDQNTTWQRPDSPRSARSDGPFGSVASRHRLPPVTPVWATQSQDTSTSSIRQAMAERETSVSETPAADPGSQTQTRSVPVAASPEPPASTNQPEAAADTDPIARPAAEPPPASQIGLWRKVK